jgi:hypothetical protein
MILTSERFRWGPMTFGGSFYRKSEKKDAIGGSFYRKSEKKDANSDLPEPDDVIVSLVSLATH